MAWLQEGVTTPVWYKRKKSTQYLYDANDFDPFLTEPPFDEFSIGKDNPPQSYGRRGDNPPQRGRDILVPKDTIISEQGTGTQRTGGKPAERRPDIVVDNELLPVPSVTAEKSFEARVRDIVGIPDPIERCGVPHRIKGVDDPSCRRPKWHEGNHANSGISWVNENPPSPPVDPQDEIVEGLKSGSYNHVSASGLHVEIEPGDKIGIHSPQKCEDPQEVLDLGDEYDVRSLLFTVEEGELVFALLPPEEDSELDLDAGLRDEFGLETTQFLIDQLHLFAPAEFMEQEGFPVNFEFDCLDKRWYAYDLDGDQIATIVR